MTFAGDFPAKIQVHHGSSPLTTPWRTCHRNDAVHRGLVRQQRSDGHREALPGAAVRDAQSQQRRKAQGSQ